MLKAKRGYLNNGIVIEDDLNRLEIFIEPYFTLAWLFTSNSQCSTRFYINKEDDLYPMFAMYYNYLKEAYIHLPHSNDEEEMKYINTRNQKEKKFGIEMDVIHPDYVRFVSDSDNQNDITIRDDVLISQDEEGIVITFSGSLDKTYYKVEFKGNHSKYNNLNIPLFRLYSVLLNHVDEKSKKLERKKQWQKKDY